jgi:hypothetical protein
LGRYEAIVAGSVVATCDTASCAIAKAVQLGYRKEEVTIRYVTEGEYRG